MHNINSEYLEILIPGFRSLPSEIKNTFQDHEVWEELIRYIGIFEEESKESHWFYTKINSEKVKSKLNEIKPYLQSKFKPIVKAIHIERYPFLKFLQQNNIDFDDSTFQQIAEHINLSKQNYFLYRFSNIPFLSSDNNALIFWNEYFEIPIVNLDSIESLHECIRILEVSILENWIFNKIELVLGYLLRNEEELFLQIKKLSHNISQNPQQELILGPVIQNIQNQVSQNLSFSFPAFPVTYPIKATYTQIFKEILGSIIKNMPTEITEIADVHAIIQASGFSTQNEHSHLAILDFVNYLKYTEEIKNIKSISNALIRPLLPLYLELSFISHQPKNIVNIFRIILPMILIATYLIAIETLFKTIPALIALMSMLHAPELAILLVFVVNLYIGLVLLSYTYENLKNIHEILTNLYYNGRYQTPVYQVNERMKTMFKNDLAEKIRDFYTQQMKNLDIKIQKLDHQAKHTGLNEQEIQLRETSQDTRKKLELEWMGIHHLSKYATNKAKDHVKNRLQEKIKEKYEAFNNTRQLDLIALPNFIKNQFTEPMHPISLFKPKCLEIKSEIENLVTLRSRMP